MKHFNQTLTMTLAAAITILSACDSKPGQMKFVPGGDTLPEVILSNDANGKGQGTSGTKEELPLELLLGPGSQMRLLDGKALTAHYANIFDKQAYGFDKCKSALPAEASDCTDSIFTPAESPLMGSFDVNNVAARGAQNMVPPHNLTLNYMKNLRQALARECLVLVTAERVKLKAGTQATNKLVKAAAPTAADLDEFFRTLIGLKGSGIKVSIGSEDYVAAFGQVVAAASSAADKEKAIDQAYLGLCVAISMNPQVIIY
jgi:hypothetical protein